MEDFERRYKEERKIGKGAHSILYLVEELKTKKKFALKRVNKLSDSYQPSSELEILKAIKKQPHRHIIRPKEWIEDHEQQLIVMEYAPKGNLKKYFKSNDLISEARVRRMFNSILEAVEHLHEKIGVAHGDIKMENILVDENEEPKLIDFNLSFFHDPNRLQTNYAGTYYYCSPEILQAIPFIGPPQDVWSLGVLLYYMLFKTYPFTSDQTEKKNKKADIRAKVIACTLGFPDIQGRKLSVEVEQLLKSIFIYEPSDRPTVQQLRRNAWFSASLVDTLCVKGHSEDVFAELEWESSGEGGGRAKALWHKFSSSRSRSSSTSSASSTSNSSSNPTAFISPALSSSLVMTHRNLVSTSQTYSCVSTTSTFSSSGGTKTNNILPPIADVYAPATSIEGFANFAQEEYSTETLASVGRPSNYFLQKVRRAFSCCTS